MDFDPSQFLAMAMSEEQNTAYTAPDLVLPPHQMLTMEGGLQMEQNMHIPVPLFGNLQLDSYGMEGNVDNGYVEHGVEIDEMDSAFDNGLLEPGIEINEGMPTEDTGNGTSLQSSPVDRTSSPHTTGKKIIVTTFDETRFRKDFYFSKYERVKLFRLHCTICDKHLGCAPWLTERQMRTHKLLCVPSCRKCFEFYGDINFPIEDGSEIYCCWCGEGGEVFCCAKCPKTVCKRCIKRNFGEKKIKEIDENDNWICFVCNPTDIYPHRAIIWGLQRFSKQMRQAAAFLPKEKKQEQLSRDSSHCCQKGNLSIPAITLPFKNVMSKIPLCLIAGPHKAAVLKQPDGPKQQSYFIPFINNNVNPHPNQPVNTQGPSLLQNHLSAQPRSIQAQPNQLKAHRGGMNRTVPYPTREINSPSQVPQRTRYHETGQISQRKQASSVSVNDRNKSHATPPQTNYTEINIDWLEKGIDDVYHTMGMIKQITDEFHVSKSEFKHDITKVTAFSDQLSHSIKIAICSLAKANQNMIDARKSIVDEHVNTIVSHIKASVSSSQRPPAHRVATPVANTSQMEEDLPGMNAALLCETVLEVEGNKENENGNKYQNSPEKRPLPKPKSLQKGRSLLVNKRKELLRRQSSEKSITVINLVDDDDDNDLGFDESHYCKKYKITPCKVILTRCN